jgi:hypothetical protein
MKPIKGYDIKVDSDCMFYLKKNSYFNKRFKVYINDKNIKKIINILVKLEADEYVASLAAIWGWKNSSSSIYRVGWFQIKKSFEPLSNINGKKAQQLWLALNR